MQRDVKEIFCCLMKLAMSVGTRTRSPGRVSGESIVEIELKKEFRAEFVKFNNVGNNGSNDDEEEEEEPPT